MDLHKRDDSRKPIAVECKRNFIYLRDNALVQYLRRGSNGFGSTIKGSIKLDRIMNKKKCALL